MGWGSERGLVARTSHENDVARLTDSRHRCACILRTEQCTDQDDSFASGYKHLRALSFGFIAIWPIGFPFVVAVLLYVSRKWSSMSQRIGLTDGIRFLHAEYNLFYWELIELNRKNLLTVSRRGSLWECREETRTS